jgi:hypothetical protein
MKYIALLLLTGCCSGRCITVEIEAGGDVILGGEGEAKCPVAPAMRKKIMQQNKQQPHKKYDMKGRRMNEV